MPDLQSEMLKLARQWDEQTPKVAPNAAPVPPTKTGNLSRDTFEFIKANPGSYTYTQTAKKVADLMGYKFTSVQALITHLKRAKLVGTNEDGALFPIAQDYVPVLSAKQQLGIATKVKRKAKPTADTAVQERVIAPKTATSPLKEQRMLMLDATAEAYQLYRELHKYFGGAR